MKRLLTFALPAVALACNALLGLDELSPFADDRPDSGPNLEPIDEPGTGSSSSSGGASSGVASSSGSMLVPPDGGNPGGDAGVEGEAGIGPCDPNELPDLERGLFVRSDAPPNGDGRPNAPFSSVAEALHALADAAAADAEPRKDTLYVYEGIYNETAPLHVRDLPRLTIDGAWRGEAFPAWTRDCSDNRRLTTVINTLGEGGLHLERVERAAITNLSLFTGIAAASGSHITVRATGGGQLLLSMVGVFAEQGAHSEMPPPAGQAPPDCASTCQAAAVAGADGSDSQSVRPGYFDAQGYTRPRGETGEAGGAGSRQAAPSPPRVTCSIACSPQCTPITQEREGAAGQCGCGGGGGLGGQGALGGGASVGVLTDGTLRAEYSIIRSSDGGDGAPGGLGGQGGTPIPGVDGANDECVPADGCCNVNGQGCYLRSDPMAPEACRVAMQVVPGGAGGGGGVGGRGGAGGPGAGGPSYGVVLIGSGHATFHRTQIAHGAGGLGLPPALGGETGVLFTQSPQ